MQPVQCPVCGQDFTDTLDRLNIMLANMCVACQEELEKWEDEGGR